MPVTLESFSAEYPHLMVFRCERLRSRLTPTSCSNNFMRADCGACFKCPIGAEHAANSPRTIAQRKAFDDFPRYVPLQARPCVRCQRPTHRLVAAELCVPCLNRQYEVFKWRNSKHKAPVKAAANLYRCTALVAGELTQHKFLSRFNSLAKPKVCQTAGGALIFMAATGQAEVRRWLTQAHPGVVVIDFEQSSSFLDIAKKECRSRCAALKVLECTES